MTPRPSGILGCLDRGSAIASERLAVECGETRITHRQLRLRCVRLAAALRGLGLADGDRVAVCATNCHRVLELYIAAGLAGLVFVPLDPELTEAELDAALAHCTPRILFVDGRRQVQQRHGRLLVDLCEEYETLLAGRGEPVDPEAVSGDTVAALLYTGGTTGAPKAVMLRQANLVANANHYASCAPFGKRTRWLIAAPMSHISGTMAVLATAQAGGCSVIAQATDAAALLDTLAKRRITSTLVVPTLLAELADRQLASAQELSALRCITHGGAPVAQATLARAARAFPDAELVHLYGATETSPIATVLRNEQRLINSELARSCGVAVPGVSVTVVDSDGQAVPAGRVGEIQISGPNVMAGYWAAPRATASALRPDGSYGTGDVGYLDASGHLFIVDRAKDVIVTAGRNVHSTEVEQTLCSHPCVQEAAVFATPAKVTGEAVAASVVPRHGTSPTPEELRTHCARYLSEYKVPSTIAVAAGPLPRTRAGKIDKRALREPYWRDADLAVGPV